MTSTPVRRLYPAPTDAPKPGETLEQYLERLDLLGHGFGYRELVSRNPLSRRHRKPPEKFWPNLASTLRLAIEFRRRAMDEAGVEGLRVAAAYRPLGGAPSSAHKTASALDLDRIGGDSQKYFRCAVRLWSEHGGGLGLYTATSRALGGIRVHLDTGGRTRTWQGIGRGFGAPWSGRPLSIKLLAELGLPDPR